MAQAKKGRKAEPVKEVKQKSWIHSPEWQIVLMFVGLGVLFLVIGIVANQYAPSAKGWPTVEGEITESVIETVPHETKQGTVNTYDLKIVYSYVVGDETYTSERLDLDNNKYSSTVEALIQTKAEEYPVGKTLTVYYDETNPEMAVLDPEGSKQNWFFIGSGVIGGLGIFIALMLLSLKKDKQIKVVKASYKFK